MVTLKTLFIITVSTSRFFFPGVPAATGLPETAKQPAVRSLSMEVASNRAAPTGAKASIAVPEGLKIAPEIGLQIVESLPKPATAQSSAELAEYWGSGRQIGANQPKITKSAPATASLEDVPDKSYAYWPPANSKPLDDDAALAGTYTFKTNYCGGAQVTLADAQSFLDPINVTSAGDFDLDKPIVIRWKPVPNAAGYLLKAYGGDANRTITWTSSAKPELAAGIDYRPVSKTDLESFIKQGVLIPPYVISCTIPAGVFKGSEGVMLLMTAVGKDIVQADNGAETWVVVRSTASVPLHSAPFRGLRPTAPKNADRDKDDSTE